MYNVIKNTPVSIFVILLLWYMALNSVIVLMPFAIISVIMATFIMKTEIQKEIAIIRA